MKTIKNPTKKEWAKLMQRPAVEQKELFTLVNQIFAEIRKDGYKAVKKYSYFFDKVDLEKLEVNDKQLNESVKNVSSELQNVGEKIVQSRKLVFTFPEVLHLYFQPF